MNLKNTYRLVGAVTLLSIFASCSSSYQTASNFNTRKYTKGYFFNGRGSYGNAVAKNNTPVTTKTPAGSNTTAVKNQSSSALAVAAGTSTKVAPAVVEKSKAIPSQVNSKKLSKTVVLNPASSHTSTGSISFETPGFNNGFFNPENANSIKSVSMASSYRSRGGDGGGKLFDFQNHLVRTILVIILIIVIVGLILVGVANGDATVSAS